MEAGRAGQIAIEAGDGRSFRVVSTELLLEAELQILTQERADDSCCFHRDSESLI